MGAEREAAWAPAQEVENESNVGRFVGEIYKGDERGSGWEEGGRGWGWRESSRKPPPPPARHHHYLKLDVAVVVAMTTSHYTEQL